MKFFALLALIPSLALASTDPAKVESIDNAREGNLAQLVLKNFRENHKVDCQEGLELPAFSIMKIDSGSSNHEKVPSTPYDYEAGYLVVQKCLSGSTFGGAYASVAKSVIMSGSFTSKYNRKNGPAKMENLQIKLVKEIDIKTQN